MIMNNEFDVLIVDDEQVVIDSIMKICTFMKYTVITASGSASAIEILKKKNVRLIVADIMMPEINGFDFLSEIIKQNIITPVILTSGNASIDIINKSFGLGAIDFLPKPFSFDELESFIARGLSASTILRKKKTDSNGLQYVSCPSNYKNFGKWNWISFESNIAKVGVSDFFMKVIGSKSNISLLDMNERIIIGENCISITDGLELNHNIIAPVSGIINAVNENIIENYSLLEKDPYFEGWIYKVRCTDLAFEEKYLLSCASE